MRDERLHPAPRIRIDRIDVLLGCALLSMVVSYGLGYRLDWRRADSPLLSAVEEEEDEAPGEESAAKSEQAAPPEEPAAALQAPAQADLIAGSVSSWARDPRDESWDRMTEELQRLASGYHGRVSIYLKDLKSEKTWTYKADDLFPSASLIKVPVMASVFYRIHDGQLSLYDKLTLRRRNRMGGSGSLKWRPDGTKLTVRELLQHMICESDNTATAMLLETLGLGYVQQQFPKMGLLSTGIYREGMSLKGSRVAHENYTTAREMSMLLEKIYRGELVDKPSSELMMDILKHKRAVASRLAKGLPVGWEIAHKTGLLRRACHDSAIVLTPDGDYALTVLTGQNRNYRAAKDFITRLGRLTFRHYKGQPILYAKVPRHHRQLALR